MKKLLIIIASVLLFTACSESTNEPTQDYTSFVFVNRTSVEIIPNCVVGYYDSEGYCWKIAELGDIRNNAETDEVTINNKDIIEVHLFSDYAGTIKVDKAFALKNKIKNTFIISSGIKGIEVDKNNPKEYPQEKSPN